MDASVTSASVVAATASLERNSGKVTFVEVDDNYPKYIINNKEKFDYLIKK